MPNEVPSRAYRPFVIAALVVCIGGVAWLGFKLDSIGTGLSQQNERIEDVLRRVRMQTLTTTWTSGGQEYSVSTVRREAEDTQTFIARHDDTVMAMQAIHPPDGR